ncbi:MAG: two-component sensor histidine kinase [Planctomycetes bacterium]|nr:two-component sensor histidine kinase [Planctomycetota bacterium]
MALAFALGLLFGFFAAAGALFWLHRRQRRRIEEAARRAREEEQGALLEHLAGGLAHEIRNPLSTLSMNIQLLREDWANPVSEREQRGVRKLDTILHEIQRLEKVLEDLLRFAAGHRLRLERIDVNKLVDELLDFFTPHAEKTRVRLTRRLSPSLPAIEADANLLRQALHNLLLNAQQAMPGGGEIVVHTSAKEHAVHVAVSDTGPGILPDVLPQIFNLYFSTKPGGTGLGLPMAKKIVDEHHGRIDVVSEPDRGTTFTVALPARWSPDPLT